MLISYLQNTVKSPLQPFSYEHPNTRQGRLRLFQDQTPSAILR